jgi:hypothetical protein
MSTNNVTHKQLRNLLVAVPTEAKHCRAHFQALSAYRALPEDQATAARKLYEHSKRLLTAVESLVVLSSGLCVNSNRPEETTHE